MKFQPSLIEGIIHKRYKRFLADIEVPEVGNFTAHVPNTGKMTSCWEPGQRVLVSESQNPKRKLKYTLEMTHNGETWIGVNTSLPSKLFQEAFDSQKIQELNSYKNIKKEVVFGESRIDFFLSQSDKFDDCFLEIKSVTLKEEDGNAYFPDTVSARGTKHIKELIKIKKAGMRAILFFIVQREDVKMVLPAKHLDSLYAKTLKEAINLGVEVIAYQCKLTKDAITLNKPIPFAINS